MDVLAMLSISAMAISIYSHPLHFSPPLFVSASYSRVIRDVTRSLLSVDVKLAVLWQRVKLSFPQKKQEENS